MCMKRTIAFLVFCLLPLLAAGCEKVSMPTWWGRSGDPNQLGVWESAGEDGHGYRPDGQSPLPPAWPVVAFVTQTERQAAYRGVLSNATLYLAAGPDIRKSDSAARLLTAARLATPCRSAHLGGRWLRFARGQAELFSLVYDAPVSGAVLSLFTDDAWHDEQYQSHQFSRVFTCASRLPVYFGDINNDGKNELLVSVEPGGKADPAYTYRVLQWTGQTVTAIGQVDYPAVLRMDHLVLLTPDLTVKSTTTTQPE